MGLGVAVLVTSSAGRMSLMSTVAESKRTKGPLTSAPKTPTTSVWESPGSPLKAPGKEHV